MCDVAVTAGRSDSGLAIWTDVTDEVMGKVEEGDLRRRRGCIVTWGP